MSRRRSSGFAAATAAALLCAAVQPRDVAAQQVTAGVVPDTVTVGQVFHAAIRVQLPAGSRAGFPDSLEVAGDVENAGRRELIVDTVGTTRRVTAIYPLTAWRPGAQDIPELHVRLVGAGRDTVLTAAAGPIIVASVLPPDTAGVKPKPPKGIVGGYGLAWGWLLGVLLALLLAAALAYWLIRRARRRRPEEGPTPLTARQRALEALDRLGQERVFGREGPIAFYSGATEAVRHYLHELHPPLGPDLTTHELSPGLRNTLPAPAAAELLSMLESADLVKFARRRPTEAEAEAERQALRDWIEGYPAPPGAVVEGEAAA